MNTNLFNNICDFLDAVEEIYPIPSHANLYDEWEESVREYLFNFVEELTFEESNCLDAVLSFRKAFHKEAVFIFKNSEPLVDTSSWEWLLTTTQVEQRTESWHREKENLLTASEIGDLWKGPTTRARLVESKLPKANETQSFTQRLAVPRAKGNALDWGVRYEPIVKIVLEKDLKIKITDLGRIRHQSIPNLAASPDGLITEGPPDLVGRLIEIKCPISRKIEESVPVAYWNQMQLQLEVCNLEACEYIEVKFKEVEENSEEAQGFITCIQNESTGEYKYIYERSPTITEGWNIIETYGWKVEELRRVTQHRDRAWFASIQKDLEAFWNDVKSAREGTWTAPPKRVRKAKAVACAIVDDSVETTQQEEVCSIPADENQSPLTPVLQQ